MGRLVARLLDPARTAGNLLDGDLWATSDIVGFSDDVIHLGHRKIRFEAIGHGQHLLRFRPTKVGSSPRASSSRSTRRPVYPVAPSNPILRLSTALPSDGLCRVVSWPAG
jgi:hypothetical protein